MTTVKPIRVAVAGAAGNIGYSLIFRIAAGGLFGPEQPVALQLLELHHALPQLEACAMELKVRGTTPAGSVAQAILGTIRSITTRTLYDRWFPAAVLSDGSYGIPRGLVFGLPLITRDGQTWSFVDDLYIDEAAGERIAANVAELERESLVISHLL